MGSLLPNTINPKAGTPRCPTHKLKIRDLKRSFFGIYKRCWVYPSLLAFLLDQKA